MPVATLIEKAQRLLKTNRVTYLEGGLYNVVGDHGTYIVRLLEDGRLVCNCTGFKGKKMCSHVLAVILRRAQKAR